MLARCNEFAKTGIKLPSKHTIADECKICPLRNSKGDCVKDIGERYGEGMSAELSGIWRRFYEGSYSVKD